MAKANNNSDLLGSLKETKTILSSPKIDSRILNFPNLDNNKARILFGKCDENLKYIERILNVEIRTQGTILKVFGQDNALDFAEQLFTSLLNDVEMLEASGENSFLDVEDIRTKLYMFPLNLENNVKGELKIKDDIQENSIKESQNLVSSCTKTEKAKITTKKKIIYARTKTQNAYIQALQRSELVFGIGPAGTGKTYLAVAYAAYLLEKGLVERIILSRPAVEAGERLGFLPGDLKEKVDPYLRPLYDALYDMIPAEKIERGLAAHIIEVAPLAFMRGRNLVNSVIILDEAQNTDPMQMKMFLTRLGEGSRMIITGDPSQIDLPHGQKSGLVEAMAILKPIKKIDFIHFNENDIIRHPLVHEIVQAYNAKTAKGSV